ncbi:MAG: 1-acyl-sn-glycerol-3-phosphate acyltransferase [Gammaproteobacteria bacterium]|nr:MAG: 1-acyl-sn-glycerol-3-phosphate acyltransferase [Gammaproteobacteria bacterium]
MQFLRCLLFTACQAVSTLIFAPLSVLAGLLPFHVRYRFIRQWSCFNLWCLKKICRLRYEVHGREHIPQGACVILCKHQSAWETYALPRIFPQPLAWACKRELLWIPFFGWGFAMLQPIAIDRGAGRRALDQLVEQGMQRLKQGRPVVIFPEGTRVAPGEKRRYAIGGAMLAEKSGYPVLPVAHNAGLLWPRNSFIKYPGTIRVVIGPVIESKGRSAAEINTLAEAWIEEKMRVLAPRSS